MDCGQREGNWKEKDSATTGREPRRWNWKHHAAFAGRECRSGQWIQPAATAERERSFNWRFYLASPTGREFRSCGGDQFGSAAFTDGQQCSGCAWGDGESDAGLAGG